jgi:hypothetical protein
MTEEAAVTSRELLAERARRRGVGHIRTGVIER